MKIKNSQIVDTSLFPDLVMINEQSRIMLNEIKEDDDHVHSYLLWQIQKIQKHLTRAKKILRDLEEQPNNQDKS